MNGRICLLLIRLGVYCPRLVGAYLLNLPTYLSVELICLTMSFLVATQAHPKVSLEKWSFLEKIFRIPLLERMWKQLVTLDTLHCYCEDPEPTNIARRYNTLVHQRESVAYFLLFSSLVIFA